MRKRNKDLPKGASIVNLPLDSPYIADCSENGIKVVAAELHTSGDRRWVHITSAGSQLSVCSNCGSDDIRRTPHNDWDRVIRHSPLVGRHFTLRYIRYCALSTYCRDCGRTSRPKDGDFISDLSPSYSTQMIDYIGATISPNLGGRRKISQKGLAEKLGVPESIIYAVKKRLKDEAACA